MILNKMRFKNFLSFGNNMTEIDLNTNDIVCIAGKNGQGKSSILSVLFFALTGKPYQSIKKNELINMHNKKGAYVELELQHKNNNYMVKRGIKPNLFEIWKNGEQINEGSHMKDYQAVLDELIGCSEKILRQYLILSSRFYVPFLELTLADKRSFIENLFSITLFSAIIANLKETEASLKLEEVSIAKDITNLEDKIETVRSYEKQINEDLEERKQKIQDEIAACNLVIENKQDEYAEMVIKQDKLQEKLDELNAVYDKRKKVDSKLSELQIEVRNEGKFVKFLMDNDNCPTCTQPISTGFSEISIDEGRERIAEAEAKIKQLDEKIANFDKLQTKIRKINNELNEIVSEMRVNNSTSRDANSKIVKLERDYNELCQVKDERKSDIDVESLEKDMKKLDSKLAKITKYKKYIDTTKKMLSEKGIKRFIMEKYIPVMNKIVNDYLEILDASYRLEFDSAMDTKIVARGYDSLGYDSFSNGEKQRCDLALLFTFLDISKMKNCVESNFIAFDEMFNGLDTIGFLGLKNILDKLKEKGYTIWLINHNEKIKELSDRVIEVKKNKFSQLEYK